MGQVNLKINGQTYSMACPDGDEDHLSELGELVQERISLLKATMGAVGDNQLLLMAAIILADELEGAQSGKSGKKKGTTKRLKTDPFLKLVEKTTADLEKLADEAEAV